MWSHNIPLHVKMPYGLVSCRFVCLFLVYSHNNVWLLNLSMSNPEKDVHPVWFPWFNIIYQSANLFLLWLVLKYILKLYKPHHKPLKISQTSWNTPTTQKLLTRAYILFVVTNPRKSSETVLTMGSLNSLIQVTKIKSAHNPSTIYFWLNCSLSIKPAVWQKQLLIPTLLFYASSGIWKFTYNLNFFSWETYTIMSVSKSGNLFYYLTTCAYFNQGNVNSLIALFYAKIVTNITSMKPNAI